MGKSIKRILITICITMLIFVLIFYIALKVAGFNLFEEHQEETKKYIAETNIFVNEEGYIETEKTIQLQLGKKQTQMPALALPLPGYFRRNGEAIFEFDVYVDNEMWPKDYIKIDNEKDSILLKNFEMSNKNIRTIKIEAKYPIDRYVEEYNNYCIIPIVDRDFSGKSIVKIHLPRKSENVFLDDWFVFHDDALKKIDDLTYEIDLRLVDCISNSFFLVLDKDIVKDALEVDIEYPLQNPIENREVYGFEFYYVAFIIVCINLVCLVVLFLISLLNRVKKEYTREPSEVIDPIFAEVIIDRKIGVKELLMSTLANLVKKGKLECVDNQTLSIISTEGLNSYEKIVMNMFFKYGQQKLSFEELRETFKKNNEKTAEFYESFSKLKENIENELINEKVFSKFGEKIIKLIRVILIATYANLIYLIIELINSSYLLFINPQALGMVTFFALLLGFGKENFSKIFMELYYDIAKKAKKDTGLKFALCSFVGAIIFKLFTLGLQILYLKELLITYTGLILLNTFTYKKAHTHLYTKKGKQIYKKAYGLKAYIEEYSLIKERELDSTIVWDDYLTYAIAFGISNKVTDLVGEDIMKANMILQRIEKSLRF
ncbi:MAG: DUF2207 domain-containing protein [Clostridia bacterium]|nr:DUF2207 domain-containing protein [Clostridia bacterium]